MKRSNHCHISQNNPLLKPYAIITNENYIRSTKSKVKGWKKSHLCINLDRCKSVDIDKVESHFRKNEFDFLKKLLGK